MRLMEITTYISHGRTQFLIYLAQTVWSTVEVVIVVLSYYCFSAANTSSCLRPLPTGGARVIVSDAVLVNTHEGFHKLHNARLQVSRQWNDSR